MTRSFPDKPDLDQYRKQAKDLRRAHAAALPDAIERIRAHHPRLHRADPEAVRSATFALADAQLVVARELGLPSWPRLKAHIEALSQGAIRPADRGFFWYADRAGRLVSQLESGGPEAFETARRWHPDLERASDEVLAARHYALADGRLMVAREHGFDSWAGFVEHLEARGNGPHASGGEPEESAQGPRSGERLRDALLAIQRADVGAVRTLVAADPGLLQARGQGGLTLLLAAASERNERLVADLLAAGADPNQANDAGWTPLHQAAYGEPPEPAAQGQSASLAVMERLLAAGANVAAESRGSGGTPLLQSLFWGMRELAERVARDEVAPRNLRTAAGLGRFDLLASFFEADGTLRREAGLARGYSAPHEGFPDHTPGDSDAEVLADALVYASVNGRLEAVEALLDRGADPNATPYQQTALFGAVFKGHANVARCLIERGADVNTRGHWAAMTDLTALHHAVSVSRLDVVRLLVEAGADLEATDGVETSTPLGWARFFENPDIVRFLEEAAASREGTSQ